MSLFAKHNLHLDARTVGTLEEKSRVFVGAYTMFKNQLCFGSGLNISYISPLT